MSVPFESLVHDIVAPYAGEKKRLCIEGPALELSARSALCLTMVLNELATNAAKYGSLSKHTGTLAIKWRTDGGNDEFALDWLERNGPTVEQPSRHGFGARLIERCVVRDLGGTLDCEFEPAGVRCRIEVPLSALSDH
jgi:two-component sensor histidine kinase